MKIEKITCLIWLFAVGSSAGFYSLGILLLFFCILILQGLLLLTTGANTLIFYFL
jgi:hypothetical protein